MIKDIAPQLAAPTLLQQSDRQSTQEETSSSCLDADATGDDGIIDNEHDDPYNNIFQSSHESLPSASPGSHIPHLFSPRRFLNVLSRHRPPADESVPQERSKRYFFSRRARSDSPLEPATMQPDQPVPEVKVRGRDGEQDDNVDDRDSANDPLNTGKDKGNRRDDPPADTQSQPSDDPTSSADLDSKDNRNLWKRIMHDRGKDPTNTKIAPAMKCPEVVEVYAVRGFQRYVAMKRVRKAELPPVTCSAPPAAAHANSLSLSGSSLQALSVQAGPSSHAVVGSGSQYLPATGGPSSHASPSHSATNYHTSHDSDSHSSIDGSCNRFFGRICFPHGHYHEDS
ncbi:hypothetical protein EDB19DRAFT_1113981 [Suillus lakei]|nr:hypothetical protein EDB19DRAFT_1113981 [Suillus lakei]